MQILPLKPPDAAVEGPASSGWLAELELRFGRVAGRTVVKDRRHKGPLLVQRPLYPEGGEVCHTIVLHPPGGIAGGDRLALQFAAEPAAHVLVTTPAATKWYRSLGDTAIQHGTITVDDGAVVEWLPLESIVFDKARVRSEWRINLAGAAVYAGWEVVCLGRRASGESFREGRFRQSVRVYRDDSLLWADLTAIAGSDPLLKSPIGLHGNSVFGTMIIAAGPVPHVVRDAGRAVRPRDGIGAVTALPTVFAARYLGQNAEAAKAYFATLWSILRPWYAARRAHRPRLWDT